MAPFSSIMSFVFVTVLSLSLQINGRESQFFSKVTHAKETQLPNNEESANKAEQEPVFIPETDNSYGLYGHESGQLPPTTTTATYQPYKTESEEYMKKNPYNKYSYYKKDAYNTNQNDFSSNNDKFYFNKDGYDRNQNELVSREFTEGVYNSVPNQKRNNQKYYNSNNGVNDRYHYSSQRQGMSDTRFMDGGRFYYDVESERSNPTFHGDSTSKNWKNGRVYFGGPNHVNSYENNNSMEVYQKQGFEGNRDEYGP